MDLILRNRSLCHTCDQWRTRRAMDGSRGMQSIAEEMLKERGIGLVGNGWHNTDDWSRFESESITQYLLVSLGPFAAGIGCVSNQLWYIVKDKDRLKLNHILRRKMLIWNELVWLMPLSGRWQTWNRGLRCQSGNSDRNRDHSRQSDPLYNLRHSPSVPNKPIATKAMGHYLNGISTNTESPRKPHNSCCLLRPPNRLTEDRVKHNHNSPQFNSF